MAAPTTNIRLEEVLRNFFENRLKEIWTCFPAQVESYDEENDTVDCIPSIMMIASETFETIEPGILRKVPVVRHGGGGWRIKFPIRVGQQILILVSNRGLDDWKEKLEKGSMPDDGLWSQKDSLAFPLSIGEDWKTAPTETFEITNESGDKKISIDTDSVDATVGDAKLSVSSTSASATNGESGLEVDASKSRINFGMENFIQADNLGLKLVAGTTSLRILNDGRMVLEVLEDRALEDIYERRSWKADRGDGGVTVVNSQGNLESGGPQD